MNTHIVYIVVVADRIFRSPRGFARTVCTTCSHFKDSILEFERILDIRSTGRYPSATHFKVKLSLDLSGLIHFLQETQVNQTNIISVVTVCNGSGSAFRCHGDIADCES